MRMELHVVNWAVVVGKLGHQFASSEIPYLKKYGKNIRLNIGSLIKGTSSFSKRPKCHIPRLKIMYPEFTTFKKDL